MAIWDADKKLESLADEIAFSDGSNSQAAKRIFDENLVLAAHSICHVALYDENAKTRLDAAKYVVERGLGKIGDPSLPEGADDPFDLLLRDIVRSAPSAG